MTSAVHPVQYASTVVTYAPPPLTNEPSALVELSLACENLVNLDMLSKSDPIVVVYFEEAKGRPLLEIGRTEVIKNNLNPKFVTTFKMKYFFESVQQLVLRIYDIDNNSTKLDDHDFIGEIRCTLADIVSSRGGHLKQEIRNHIHPTRKNGVLVMNAVELTKPENIKIQFLGKGLDKKDFFGKSDPYLKIYRIVDDSIDPPGVTLVHKTEVVKNHLNPTWVPFEIPLNKLVGSGFDLYGRSFYVECYDWDAHSSHDLIGVAKIRVSDLLAQKSSFTVDLINPKKKSKSSYKNSGLLCVGLVELTKDYSFMDYITSGTEVSFGVAIDFTASNGNPVESTSLHFIDPSGAPNDYMKAIWGVGNVIMPYDADKNFPVFGFGAKFPTSEIAYHDFHVNFNPKNPEVTGVDGIMAAYQNCIRNVQLYGPTNFAPVIRKMSAIARLASDSGQCSKYFVLLIITDGEITDFEDTVEAIIDASELPFSIVIVGVGAANFDTMNALDSDNQLLKSKKGRVCARDIVQFVPFRNFQDSAYGPELLAREVLAEIPEQLVSYMKTHNIKPGMK
ncbi:Copine-domain-containing protein [Paraphysoderma sedebokerense]|nr:Copine-domain-containing protein [Paraphysoderma sedebokerense]